MPAFKARKKIFHDEDTRSRIHAALIINRLTDCLNGKVELSQAQVTCGKTLLNKVLPDLQSTTIDGQLRIDPLAQLLDDLNGKARSVPGG